ncbi:protein FAM149A-like [Latimeria chalumnae]|uniref:protein FAM149A-like n=1 Tax=Latimeria chalumnae TaxID=7897 RepID=UPI00313EE3A5
MLRLWVISNYNTVRIMVFIVNHNNSFSLPRYTGLDHISSSSIQNARVMSLPPINSETVDQQISVPRSRHVFHRARYPHSRVSSAVPDSTGRRPLRERPVTVEHFSRPNTTHTFRSDTPFKRSFTPMDFTIHNKTGQSSLTGHASIGVTGVSLGITGSSTGNNSDSVHHPHRHLLNHSPVEGEEDEYYSTWGSHFQPKSFSKNPTNTRKRFQMVT